MDQHYGLFLLVLAVIIVGCIFLFNLDDKVFGSLTQDKINNLESSTMNESLLNEAQILKTEYAQQNDLETKEDDSKTKTKTLNPEILEIEYKEKDLILDTQLIDETLPLENKKFHLVGTGEAWESKSSIKPLKINATLKPVKGTNLSTFDLIDCEIKIGQNTYNFNKGSVEIKKSKLTFTIIPEVENSIFFSMTGSLNSKITNSNYKGKIVFNDEPFYIYSPEKKLFHMSYETTFYSSQD